MRAYWEFLRIPGALRLLLTSTFPRLAYAMVGLAVFFSVEESTGSIATAGLAVGACTALGAITAGPRGHLVDRFGQTKPLVFFVPLYAVSTLLMAFFSHGAVSAVVLSGLIGVTAPPINLSVRPLWKDIVGVERVRMAYSIDSAWTNALQLIGPLIATALALSVSPRVALIAVSACMLVGGLLLAVNVHSRSWVPEERVEDEHGLMRSPAMRVLALEGVAMGLSAGFVLIGLPAVAILADQPDLAGWLMAAMGVGSIIGSIWAGARAHGIAPANGLRMSVALYAVFLLPLAFVPVGPWMVVIVILAWTVLGPAQVFYIETVDVVRPRGTAVAALGSLWMIEGAATAIGNAVGGSVAQWVGPHVTLGLAAVMAIGSPIIFTLGMRRSLKPATVPPANMSATAD